MFSKIGVLELIILLMAALAVIGAYVLALTKLFKSKLSPAEKMIWLFIMLFFHFLGLVSFLIYHDYYLRREFRTNL
jgi:uncharacterized membrane protein